MYDIDSKGQGLLSSVSKFGRVEVDGDEKFVRFIDNEQAIIKKNG